MGCMRMFEKQFQMNEPKEQDFEEDGQGRHRSGYSKGGAKGTNLI